MNFKCFFGGHAWEALSVKVFRSGYSGTPTEQWGQITKVRIKCARCGIMDWREYAGEWTAEELFGEVK